MSTTETPLPIKRQIHTVLLCGNKKQGVALGIDGETGQALRIWLLTPKAVDYALKQIAGLANAVGRGRLHITAAKPARSRRLNVTQAKEWVLR